MSTHLIHRSQHRSHHRSQRHPQSRPRLLLASALGVLLLAGCQTLPTQSLPATSINDQQRLQNFNIHGRIGITTPATDTTPTQAVSAFYAWGQEHERFAIELTGALGIGQTLIEYNGQTATLTSERTGTLSADSPEDLLRQATGWYAPISQLPYWISGLAAPSDTAASLDEQRRLIRSQNAGWTAEFRYAGSVLYPDRISMTHDSGHRVVLTISHR